VLSSLVNFLRGIHVKQVVEVFWRFLMLGCISFGGPAAHIGYFKAAFVDRYKWLDEHNYAQLISLSQFLPGPGSSQIGFAIGLQRAGIWGGIAAFLGFTLPSFILLYLLATFDASLSNNLWFIGAIHGLKLLAVVVVADAVLSMAKAFCQTKWTIMLAILMSVVLLIIPSMLTQVAVLLLAACFGWLMSKKNVSKSNVSTNEKSSELINNMAAGQVNKLPLFLFILLFFSVIVTANENSIVSIFSDFYQAGSLVFGGGHVVLPLLQQLLADVMSAEQFLLGYAAAQAVPGPMFTLAAFLGAHLSPESLLLGATVATIAIFLPGLLLVSSFAGAWQYWAAKPKVAGAIAGINAAVVGLLLSALYQPVFVSAVVSPLDMALVILGFAALRVMKIPIVLLVASFVIIAGILQVYGDLLSVYAGILCL